MKLTKKLLCFILASTASTLLGTDRLSHFPAPEGYTIVQEGYAFRAKDTFNQHAASLEFAFFDEGTNCHVIDLEVESTHQGKGLGPHLLAQLELYAREKKCNTITLHVDPKNNHALHVYQKCNFKKGAPYPGCFIPMTKILE